MARAGILYSHVAKAAAQLAADGKNPTVDSVREALGSTGSKSTIAPLLKRWKAEHQEALVETELGLPAELLQAVKGVYERLQIDVQQQLEQAREEHRLARQATADQMRQIEADNEALSATTAALSAELAQMKDALTHLQAEHHQRNVALATLQSDNAGMQLRLLDRAAEVTALNQQLTQARIQFEHYQESTVAQRSEERLAAEQRMTRLEQDLAGAQQRLLGQQSSIAQQEMQISQLRTENSNFQETTRAAQDELVLLRSERGQLTYQLKEHSSTTRVLANKLEAAQQMLTESQMALAAQEKETQLLTARLDQAEQEVEQLEQQRLVLIKERAALQAQAVNSGKAEKIANKR
ncbi:DNA-binding protein [Paraherbaspirillum soli]|uniref:DNA-binding protein n=1 Tax=Paraherbaspirillum soli TaxID=631222 RepID=A0ABW0MDB1_9BURK